jgi:hypothetical protein
MSFSTPKYRNTLNSPFLAVVDLNLNAIILKQNALPSVQNDVQIRHGIQCRRQCISFRAASLLPSGVASHKTGDLPNSGLDNSSAQIGRELIEVPSKVLVARIGIVFGGMDESFSCRTGRVSTHDLVKVSEDYTNQGASIGAIHFLSSL